MDEVFGCDERERSGFDGSKVIPDFLKNKELSPSNESSSYLCMTQSSNPASTEGL